MLFLLYKRKSEDKSLQVIFFVLVLGVLHDGYSIYLDATGRANFFAYNLNVLLETLLLYLFFWLVLKSRPIKIILAIVAYFFAAWWVYILIKFGSPAYYDAHVTFENISVLGLIILYYYEQIIVLNVSFIYSQPRFWIVTAYFIFIAGTFFLLLYIPTLNKEEQASDYSVNYLFIIVRAVLLSIGMYIKEGDDLNKQYQRQGGLK